MICQVFCDKCDKWKNLTHVKVHFIMNIARSLKHSNIMCKNRCSQTVLQTYSIDVIYNLKIQARIIKIWIDAV